MRVPKPVLLRIIVVAVLSLFFVVYVYWNIQNKEAPIDYKTFMEIGHRLRSGQPVYCENSYYPMPYVMVFAFFDWLPRDLSLAMWLLLPVLAALFISGFSPWVLLYAPLLSHFLGGQSALFGLLGLWGYRKHSAAASVAGGLWLALTTLKPQLAIAPCLWALAQWVEALRTTRRIPHQAIAFAGGVTALYLPAFLFFPDWLSQWLVNPRPMFARAQSGLFSRVYLTLVGQNSVIFWVVLVLTAVGLFMVVWLACRKQLNLDLVILFSFVVSPFVHDYDLLQLVPLFETRALKILAVLLSIPGWVVMFTLYSNDNAWSVFTIIAPGLLLYSILHWRKLTASVISTQA